MTYASPFTVFSRHIGGALIVALTALLAACAAPPKVTVSESLLTFDEAVAQTTDSLVSQTQKLPAFLAAVEAKVAKRGVVVDPMIDAASGQQTGATKLLERAVTDRMTTKFEQFELLAFQSASLARAQYLLTGTMTRAQGDRPRANIRLNLALTELKTGLVVAQATALARDDGLDAAPTAYYRDSPVLIKDKVLEGYIATSAAAPGQRADPVYFERISTATLINDATLLYNADRYQEALGTYRNALSTPAGEQMRVLNGIYLSNVKLGRTAEAEQSFGKVVAYGIAYRQLGVKFLFNPGSTEFWSDARVSGAYGMWLRQIARESAVAKACMSVVGHTSRTGSEQANDALSLQRAALIKQRLGTEAPELAARTKAVGMGFRENLVGTAADNASDALDRRVEFKIVPCS